MAVQSGDHPTYRFPVSIKGTVFQNDRVVLLKNERDEWELPGGKLELGETPEQCIVREIEEELGLRTTTGPLLDTWVYHIREGIDVLICTFGCYPHPFAEITHSPEHKAVGAFTIEEVTGLRMPDGYKQSIAAWARRLAAESSAQP
jgi:mutator protein MutT